MAISHTLGEVAAFLGSETNAPEVIVHSLGIDSRTLGPQALWVARKGQNTHGAQHLAPNAAAVITDSAGAHMLASRGLPIVVIEDPAKELGRLSDWFFGHPAQGMTMWGVTGTNGKTTVTHILEHALATLNKQPALIGTLGARAGDRSFPLSRTTPEAPEVHELLALMRQAHVTDVAMEVSSHALVLGRVDAITFDVAIFTNLSQDHLDFHGSMEAYFKAKARLFTQERARSAVINVDDEWGQRLTQLCEVPFVTYGTAPEAHIKVSAQSSASGMQVTIEYQEQIYDGIAAMMGGFNAINIAGAFAALVSQGISARSAFDAVIGAAPVPGRMEVVDRSPLVIVDYAHTPEAVDIVLTALRGSGRRLISVLGCGGDRDPLKRPLMGRIAADLSDEVVITDDNPRSEDPGAIRAAVAAGAAQGSATVRDIGDRGLAITSAISHAQPEDVVVILGKGAEQGQEVDGSITDFDDRVVARAAIAGRMKP